MTNLCQKLQLCASTLALAAAASFVAGSAMAQDIETVTVTGSSIRGVQVVGSNMISVTTADIENSGAQSLMDVVRNIPALSDMGGQPVGNLGNNYFSPNIHQLGHSASNSTLVIADGVQLPRGGVLHALTDPSIIPTIAIERVDVLATGASSIYGSDAVAGVVNFITRKSYDGLMIQGQAGVATQGGYLKDGLGAIWGTHWDSGNVYLALQYSFSSAIRSDARDFFNPDHRQDAIDAGLNVTGFPNVATNFNTFQCNPASIQMTGMSTVYPSASSLTAVPNDFKNFPCNTIAYSDGQLAETRYQTRVSVTQNFGDLKATLALNYSYRSDHQRTARGGLSGTTVFQTGPQANPFYKVPAGYTGTATSQVVRWNADALLGPGATNNGGTGAGSATDFYSHLTLVYPLGDFNLTYDNMLGQNLTYSNEIGQLNQSVANLALNGTTQSNGDTTRVSIPGTTQLVLALPLTTANALDVWNPAGPTNRTSPEVIKALGNSRRIGTAFLSTLQHRLILDGPLFELPGGMVKVAVGADYTKWTDMNEDSQSNNTGTTDVGASAKIYHFGRHIESAFLEFNIPLVGADMNLPYMQALTLNISGRHDSMSDVGHTTNPKYALDWQVFDGLSFKANYSTAFVPPQLISIGDATQNYAANYASVSPSTGTFSFLTANFPGTAGVLPGCAAGAVSCQLTSATPGLSLNGGGGLRMKPAKGIDWSLAMSYAPTWLDGLNLDVTYFNDKAKGLVNSLGPERTLTVKALNPLITICPTTCTQAQINGFTLRGFPLSAPAPSPIYYLNEGGQNNAIFFNVQGLDIGATYNFDTDWGHFTVAENVTQFIQFDFASAPGDIYVDVLGTNGYSNGPNVAFFSSSRIGWVDPSATWEVNGYMSWVAGYRNWSSSTVEPIVFNGRVPIGGGDHVKATVLFDAHIAYNFTGGMMDGHQVYLDIKNIADSEPEFYNGGNGFSNNFGNPIGRLVSTGFRLKF